MKIAMLFPGYGTQFVGMGKELYDESRIMQEYFEEASNCLGMNFVKLCFASSDVDLSRMAHAYPSIFLVSSAICALLKEQGIKIDVVLGHDLGEVSACHAAGGMSFPDGLYLLAKYTEWYQEVLSNLDAAALQVEGLTGNQLQKICTQVSGDNDAVFVAIYDAPLRHTIMGNAHAVGQAQVVLQENEEVKVEDGLVEIGLHSPLMDPVVVHLKLNQEKIDFKDLAIPLITNADAKPITQWERIRSAMIKQIHSPLLWQQSIEQLASYDIIVQVGPGSSLMKLVETYYPEKKCLAINQQSDIDQLKKLIE
jgi:[acyl-carrier-protein] S-malonyltransferase